MEQPLELTVYDAIDQGFSGWLQASVSGLTNGQSLTLSINSPGGDVSEGFAAYTDLKRLSAKGVKTTAIITGVCASMATIVALACDTVLIAPKARFMIHNPSGVVKGDAASLRKAAKTVEAMTNDMAEIYAKKTKKRMDTILAMMAEETWMTAQQALDNKFVDAILEMQSPTAYITERWVALAKEGKLYVPLSGLKDTEDIPGGATQNPNEDETMSAELSAKIDSLVAGMTALQKDVAEMKAENATLKRNNEVAQKVDQLIAEGKMPVAMKATVTKLMLADETAAMELVNAFPKTEAGATAATGAEAATGQAAGFVGLTDFANAILASAAKTGAADKTNKANWNFRDWQNNDPQGLQAMYDKEPEKFKALRDAFYEGKNFNMWGGKSEPEAE